ncbi:hypothetical protein AB0N05_13080 [Nocardia sp. NPDC051030]|uniref:hypothetical protein n=1 Tax=Nocardia sp. NPDC051030 TaxID=3155162 RepID=UPI0034186D7D
MQQGQVWVSESRISGRKSRIVVVDGDTIANLRQRLIVAPIREGREVPNQFQLLSVPLPGTSEIIAVYDLLLIDKESFTEYEGSVSSETLERIKTSGLGARFDL